MKTAALTTPVTSARTQATPVQAGKSLVRFWLDLIIVAAIIGGWFALLADPVHQRMPVVTDTFRDSAYVENILEGRIFDDPSTAGFSYWYPPGGPLLYAAAVRLTGLEPLELYSLSILWVNVWIPVGLFLVVRLYWDRVTAVLALLMVLFGSRWWEMYLATPMPSIQGMILLLLALAIWQKALRARFGWSVVLGVVLALSFWIHILSAMMACGAIACHSLLWARNAHGEKRFSVLTRATLAGGVCALLVWPLIWHLMRIPLNNPAPPCYYAPQLSDPDYALHLATPLMIPVALLGLFVMSKKLGTSQSWVIGYLFLGLIGQTMAYIKRWTGWPIPILLPHEFQWHGQVATGILAAVGVLGIARYAVERIGHPLRRRVATVLAAVVLVLLTLGPDKAGALNRFDAVWVSGRCSADVQATMNWIKRHSDITDVFVCRYLPAYSEVAGRTGRKLILMPELRANMAADTRQRRRDLYRIETTHDPEEFMHLAVDRYGARFAYLTDRKQNLLDRWTSWDMMEIAYRSPHGKRTILRIIDHRHAGDKVAKKGSQQS